MRIMFVKVPSGEAPEWVRQAWVGLTVDCYGLQDEESANPVCVLSRKPITTYSDVWLVPQAQAIEILRRSNAEAARWWTDNGWPREGCVFTFQRDEAIPVDGPDSSIARG